MPYYISGEVAEEDIVFNSAEDLKEKYDLEIYLKTEVIEIHTQKNQIQVVETSKGTMFNISYDYLVLSVGSIAKRLKEFENLDEKAKFLHENELVKLHITNDLGTDLYVGLPKNHIWQSAGSYAKKADRFVANIPTEEVFTMPHKDETSGIVYNAKPLNSSGVLIDNLWLKFEDGKVVDFGAERGYDVLKNLLETDEGSRRIGEMALVPYDSPISNTKILFLETLFDENAACHIALGKAYPTCVQGGPEMTDEQLAEVGANDSLVHVDFMIGEATTNITGFTADGKEVAIFKDGNWA